MADEDPNDQFNVFDIPTIDESFSAQGDKRTLLKSLDEEDSEMPRKRKSKNRKRKSRSKSLERDRGKDESRRRKSQSRHKRSSSSSGDTPKKRKARDSPGRKSRRESNSVEREKGSSESRSRNRKIEEILLSDSPSSDSGGCINGDKEGSSRKRTKLECPSSDGKTRKSREKRKRSPLTPRKKKSNSPFRLELERRFQEQDALKSNQKENSGPGPESQETSKSRGMHPLYHDLYDADGRPIPVGPTGVRLPLDPSGRLFPHVVFSGNLAIPVHLASDGVLRLPNLTPCPQETEFGPPLNIDGQPIILDGYSRPMYYYHHIPTFPPVRGVQGNSYYDPRNAGTPPSRLSPTTGSHSTPYQNPIPVPQHMSPIPQPVPAPALQGEMLPMPVPRHMSPVPQPVPASVSLHISPVPQPVPAPVSRHVSPVPQPVPAPVPRHLSPVPQPVPALVSSPAISPILKPLLRTVPQTVPASELNPKPPPPDIKPPLPLLPFEDTKTAAKAKLSPKRDTARGKPRKDESPSPDRKKRKPSPKSSRSSQRSCMFKCLDTILTAQCTIESNTKICKKYTEELERRTQHKKELERIKKNLGVASSKSGVKKSTPAKLSSKKGENAAENGTSAATTSAATKSHSASQRPHDSSTQQEESSCEGTSKKSSPKSSKPRDEIEVRIDKAYKCLLEDGYTPPKIGRFIVSSACAVIPKNISPLLRHSFLFFNSKVREKTDSSGVTFRFTEMKEPVVVANPSPVVPTPKPKTKEIIDCLRVAKKVCTFESATQCDLFTDDYKKLEAEASDLKFQVKKLSNGIENMSDVCRNTQEELKLAHEEIKRINDRVRRRDEEIRNLKGYAVKKNEETNKYQETFGKLQKDWAIKEAEVERSKLEIEKLKLEKEKIRLKTNEKKGMVSCSTQVEKVSTRNRGVNTNETLLVENGGKIRYFKSKESQTPHHCPRGWKRTVASQTTHRNLSRSETILIDCTPVESLVVSSPKKTGNMAVYHTKAVSPVKTKK